MKQKLTLVAVCLALAAPWAAAQNWPVARIVIDPGHCGTENPGAAGPSAPHEGELALRCARDLRDLITKAGASVRMTHNGSGDPSLSARRNMASSFDAHIFQSIHLNAFNGSAHGTETYYYFTSGHSSTLANCVHSRLVSKLGLTNRGVKTANYTVMMGSSAHPAILTEGLFVDNYSEWSMIKDQNSAGYKAWVDAHILGWWDFMKSVHHPNYQKPPTLSDGGGSTPTPTPQPTTPTYPLKDAPNQRNVYAYNVKIDKTAPYAPVVTYDLTSAAKSVTVDIYVNDVKLRSTAGTCNLTGNSVHFYDVYGTGTVSAKVTAVTKTEVSIATRVSFPLDANPAPATKGILRFYNPVSVAINNCPDSPTFGHMLVAEKGDAPDATYYSYNTSKQGRGGNMLYAFDPLFKGVANTQTSTKQFGYSLNHDSQKGSNTAQTAFMARLRYSDDGRLFMVASNLSQGGLMELGTSDIVSSLNGNPSRVYYGTFDSQGNQFNSAGAYVGGCGAGLAVWGKGANLKVAVAATNTATKNADTATSLDVYNLGNAKTWNKYPSVRIPFDQAEMCYLPATGYENVLFDKTGNGVTITTYAENTTDKGKYGGYHIRLTDNVFDYGDPWGKKLFTKTAAIAYNKDHTLMAIGQGIFIRIYKYVNDLRNATPIYAINPAGGGMPAQNESTIMGDPITDLAFDYANNLVVACKAEHAVTVWQLPADVAGSSQTTPSPASQNYTINHPVTPGAANYKEQIDHMYAYKGSSMTYRSDWAYADSIVLDHAGQKVDLYAHGTKTPIKSFADADLDSLSLFGPKVQPDMFDIGFGPGNSIVATTLNGQQPQWVIGGTAMATTTTSPMPFTYYNDEQGRYVANFDYTDASRDHIVAYDYKDDTAFKNKMLNGYTIEALVSLDNYANDERYFSILSSTEGGGAAIEVLNGQFQHEARIGGAYRISKGNVPVVNKRWYHIVASFDKDDAIIRTWTDGLYLGSAGASGDMSLPSNAAVQKWVLGAELSPTALGADTGWNGDIAFARLYDKAVTNEEVDAMWQRVKEARQAGHAMVTGIDYANNAETEADESIVIAGQGFAEGDVVSFVDPFDATAVFVAETELMNGGVAVTVPAGLTSGKRYILRLDREDRHQNLGVIKLQIKQ